MWFNWNCEIVHAFVQLASMSFKWFFFINLWLQIRFPLKCYCKEIYHFMNACTPALLISRVCQYKHNLFILIYILRRRKFIYMVIYHASKLRANIDSSYNWASKVKKLLYENEYGDVWENQGVYDPDAFMYIFRQRLIDIYKQNWNARLSVTEG